jgi:choline dehydrogenase-like flavoprotein
MQEVTSSEVADILIVGSGASGGPFAWHLSRVAGIKIVCLEQGEWAGKPAATGTEEEGQRQRLATPPPRRQGVTNFQHGYPYDHTNSYWQPILGNAVGGATVHYAGVWARLHPSDFVVRSLEGVADDWPIRYSDLAPYYDQIDNVVGVSGVPGNPAYPPNSVNLQPAPKLNAAAQILSRGFQRRGWHWWPVERAIITVPHRGREPCPTNCAACHDGCPHEAKNSSDVVFWPEAIRNGVVLKTRARVRQVTIDSQGRADGAEYYDADGRLTKQRARLVVLACNGIGTPRVLLNSTSNRFPHGLANSSGLVGKRLMGHPSARVVGTVSFDDDAPDDPSTIGLVSDQFYEGNPSRGFARGVWILSGGFGPPISTALRESHTPQATVIPAGLRHAERPSRMIPWGAAHHAVFQKEFKRTVGVSVFAEELPDEANRVEIDPTITDEVGIPGVKLFYRRSENTNKAFAFGAARVTEVMEAAGATEITSDIGTAAPGHYLGTARMGTNPERSVVDKWGRAHDVKNLFVIDGSVFTTGGALVPTASIHAIALRTADYIKNNSRDILK